MCQVYDSGACGEECAADPEPLGRPHGDRECVGEDEERPHREEVAELLVGDRPERNVGVPHRCRLSDETRRVDEQIGLCVRVDHTGLGRELRDEGEERQDEVLGPRDQAVAKSPAARVSRPVSGVLGCCRLSRHGSRLGPLLARGSLVLRAGAAWPYPGPTRPGSVRTAGHRAPSGER